jgi:hypothetical protein
MATQLEVEIAQLEDKARALLQAIEDTHLRPSYVSSEEIDAAFRILQNTLGSNNPDNVNKRETLEDAVEQAANHLKIVDVEKLMTEWGLPQEYYAWKILTRNKPQIEQAKQGILSKLEGREFQDYYEITRTFEAKGVVGLFEKIAGDRQLRGDAVRIFIREDKSDPHAYSRMKYSGKKYVHVLGYDSDCLGTKGTMMEAMNKGLNLTDNYENAYHFLKDVFLERSHIEWKYLQDYLEINIIIPCQLVEAILHVAKYIILEKICSELKMSYNNSSKTDEFYYTKPNFSKPGFCTGDITVSSYSTAVQFLVNKMGMKL